MITDRNKIFDDLYDNAKYYNCEGVEITDDDVAYVIKQQREGKRYDDAINDTLEGIRESQRR
jgi:hypothetical protein